eukprot:scaffold1832_cov362-Prasinococcus_capsulatus_cf.AAC.14
MWLGVCPETVSRSIRWRSSADVVGFKSARKGSFPFLESDGQVSLRRGKKLITDDHLQLPANQRHGTDTGPILATSIDRSPKMKAVSMGH